MDSKHNGQKDQQLLCCRSILHELELGWVYLAGIKHDQLACYRLFFREL